MLFLCAVNVLVDSAEETIVFTIRPGDIELTTLTLNVFVAAAVPPDTETVIDCHCPWSTIAFVGRVFAIVRVVALTRGTLITNAKTNSSTTGNNLSFIQTFLSIESYLCKD